MKMYKLQKNTLGPNRNLWMTRTYIQYCFSGNVYRSSIILSDAIVKIKDWRSFVDGHKVPDHYIQQTLFIIANTPLKTFRLKWEFPMTLVCNRLFKCDTTYSYYLKSNVSFTSLLAQHLAQVKKMFEWSLVHSWSIVYHMLMLNYEAF